MSAAEPTIPAEQLTNRTFNSVAEMFVERVKATPDRTAYQFPVGSGWQTLTWQQTFDRVQNISLGLLSLGLDPQQRVAIQSSTRVEWILADLGIMCAAGATTTVYPSNTAEECQYILGDSASRYVFAEDKSQLEKLKSKRADLPLVEKVILLEEDGDADKIDDDWVMTLSELETLGAVYGSKNDNLFANTVATIKKDHLATLIYTSGTTGVPKGVELLHDAWVFEGQSLDHVGLVHIDDHQYLWLPLSHSFGKVLEALQLYVGFKTTIDGRIPKLVENLGQVKPTFMAAAPRIFEKVYNKIVSGAQAAGGAKYKIFKWSMGVGRKVSALVQKGEEPTGLLKLQYKIATKLVFSKIANTFGGNIEFFISGSAPLSREMAEFFHAAGILILEGYGLTETSAGAFVNQPKNYSFGTVGPVMPGAEVKIAESDGEILIRGRHVMRGYHNLPEVTAEMLSEDGWLRTGDIGELTSDGKLKITDRKKDLIKTSGGKYVAPQALEGSLKALCPFISQVVVHGNTRNFCSALLTVDEESLAGFKEEHSLNGISYTELGQHEVLQNILQEAVNKLNATLASHETIKKFAVLPLDLTVEGGELTPSLKVKRKVVEAQYKDILDGFYKGALADI